MPKIYFAADHAGFALKNILIERVRGLGYAVEDMGALAYDIEDDYPDFVMPCARKVVTEPDAFAIVMGGSGDGEAMCANRIPGVRAALFYGKKNVVIDLKDLESGYSEDGFDIVRFARKHNDANVLSLGARFLDAEEAFEAVKVFLETPFSGALRHMRRIAKF
ncbi:MAG: RpiB/LacA/LacB family sugar-phosphate isomerase [Candidatus Paceibacteria bacterium]